MDRVPVSSELVRRLRGRVIPAVPVPFRRQGGMDEEAHRAYVGWMAAEPVGGVAVWAHTGRGLLLSEEDRARVLAAWREGLDLPVLCGVGVPRSAARLPSAPARRTAAVIGMTLRLAEDARRGGAAGVLVHPPTGLRDLRDPGARCVELHQAVAAVGLPVIAFSLYEAAGGVRYDARTLERILALEGVIGIKVATLDSVMTFQDIAAVVHAFPERLLITGEDRFLGYSLMLGAHAALVGIASACTSASAALLDAWCRRDFGAFVRWASALDAFGRATFVEPVEGYVQRMLWALEADGVIAGDAADPFGPALGPGERDRVRAAVRALRAA